MDMLIRINGRRRLVAVGYVPAIVGLLSLNACAGAGGSAFAGGDCSINQTAVGAGIGIAAGAALGAGLSRNSTSGALIGGAMGGLLGGMLGNQADQVCRQRAERQALDAAVARYEESQRLAAETPASGQGTSTSTVAHTTVYRKHRYAKAATKPVAPPEPTYDQITWNASSGATGTVAPEHVYQDTASNTICTTRQETLKDASGNPQMKTVKSCRDPSGNWVDSV